MGTRAAAFTVKIRSLYDYQLRLLHGVLPIPSGVDIANTIKYFSQTLLTVLKDVPNFPFELLKNPEMDSIRMALFPNLDYKGLYNSLIPLIEVAPLLQFGLEARYNTKDEENSISHSVASIIMMIFQYSNNPAHHCQLLECLMTLKQTVLKDLLCVIAYGTPVARSSSAKLLFYYWPAFNANLFDRRGLICKFAGDSTPFVCQRDNCPNAGNAEAAKVCYDHCISIMFASDSPPPLYLCIECANEIHREHPNQMFCDILHPMQQVSMVCENKNCRAIDKSAISICFSTECASYNGNHPIRYCQQCHNNRHNNRRGGDHVVHKSLPPTWTMDAEMQIYMVEAIVSLLKEAKASAVEQKEPPATGDAKVSTPNHDNISLEERQLLGRYGIWLLVGRCTPTEDTPIEILGRLLAMLFHWFHVTAYSYNGQEEGTLEKLKTEYVCSWLQSIRTTHYKLFLSCLLPHPPDYARVGGHWDTLASRTSHLKDGLHRLFCLVPYEIITPAIWDHIMPHWMEAVVNDVPEKELPELKIILSKILDPDMSPLGFNATVMYFFVAARFKKMSAKTQEQALHWLQVLTVLEITIPLSLLFSLFESGVEVLKASDGQGDTKEKFAKPNLSSYAIEKSASLVIEDNLEDSSFLVNEMKMPHLFKADNNGERNLSCCILMLDILLKQMNLQSVDKHTGIMSNLCKDVSRLLKCMVSATWINNHNCGFKYECSYCELSIMWHQLSMQLIKYLSPTNPVNPPDPPPEENLDDTLSRISPPDVDKKDAKPDVVISMPIPEIHSVGGVLVHMPHVCSIMTATVETVSEQLDLTAIMPAEKSVSGVTRGITMSEPNIDILTMKLSKNDGDQSVDANDSDSLDSWQTSLGMFRFTIDQLPEYLQYMYQLLNELCKIENPDILYYMLQCLNILCLHGDAFTRASKEQRGFFIWAQENILIKNLWDLCNAEYSHICEVTVPLLLHCITLPAGSDVFWKVIQEEFHSSDWKVRFVAVERVTVIARFMDSTPLRSVLTLQAALANAFCYLISSIDDTNVYVAQRATLYLGTIHDSAIKNLVFCLETQFDTVIVDRPMVLQSLYQLHNLLCDRKILSWEFFLNRFDTLFLEAQINLEKSGDLSYLRDLRNTDMNSDTFIRKLHRAQEALSQSDGSGTSSIKTLSASFGTKWPYKRTMSAPASMVPRHELKQEKVYSRQYSAPILKRKSSRFGLDGHLHSFNTLDNENIVGFFHRVIDLEEADKETIHLLVFLFMQFLSRSDQAYPTDDKYLSKIQSIVLRHLYLLLGYNQIERGWYISPQRLRVSPVFSAYLSNLPQLLDQNHLMGWVILNTSLFLLLYCPCPHYIFINEHQQPTYSLWYLEPHLRRCWLMSLIVLLYKYQYTQPPQCQQLQSLIRIVLNTLDSQHHHCRRIPAAVIMGVPPSRSRDVSQPSLGTDNEPMDRSTTTPPLSPVYYGDIQSSHISVSTKGGKMQVMYHQKLVSSSTGGMETHWEEDTQSSYRDGKIKKRTIDISVDADDPESELIVIPESDLSDSTLDGSVQELFEEHLDDHVIQTNCGDPPRFIYEPKILSPNSKKNRSSVEKKPVWFIGSEEESLQTTKIKSWGMQENIKMMVASAFIPNNLELQSTAKDNKKNTSATSVFSCHYSAVPKPLPKSNNSHAKTNSIEDKHTNNEFIAPMSRQKSKRTPNCTSLSDSTSDSSVAPKCDETWPITSSAKILITPSLERLLPIGVQKQTEPAKDDDNTDNNSTPENSGVELHLNLPAQERLLPVGQHSKEICQIVEKVKQALGLQLNTDAPEKPDDCSQKIPKPTQISKPGEGIQSRNVSPRKLIKQVALESPPHVPDTEEASSVYKQPNFENYRGPIHNHVPRLRKAGNVLNSNSLNNNSRKPDTWYGPLYNTWLNLESEQLNHANSDLKHSSFRIGNECVNDRCSECGIVQEEYSDEEIGLCIIVLGTFIHREPALAAPLLPDILSIVAKVAVDAMYPWQNETNMHLPGGAISVAHQFLRCILHQLAPNGVFIQIFQTQATDKARLRFFKSVSQALLDFSELNPIAPLQLLLECLNTKKTLTVDTVTVIFQNMACYLDCIPLEAGLGPIAPLWSSLLSQLEILCRRIVFFLNQLDDVIPLLKIMVSVLRIPVIAQFKGILDPFSKILGHAIQTQPLEYHFLVDICYLCNRAFTRERDKLIFCRMLIFELVQVLKFKTSIPDSNFITLINLVLQDIGGAIPTSFTVNIMSTYNTDYLHMLNVSISDCMRLHLGDILEFIMDFHALNKLKSYRKGADVGLHDDTLGGLVKGSIAQYVALEMTRSNGRDNRAVSKYLPWLCHTLVFQQGAREFLECIGHIRLLSWLLLGSLIHTSMYGLSNNLITSSASQPIPQEASCQIADHIQVIMTGFAEQPKASVLHMSSLFHVFILCQLWTVYLEQGVYTNAALSENFNVTMNILFDFWGKVTPYILQLMTQSKMLCEMVSLHFLCMLEALIESRSTFLNKLLPMWTPILFSHHLQLPGHLHVRLQNCRNFTPLVNFAVPSNGKQPIHNPVLLRWLQRLQFKMGQIELQSSAATQFYSL